ALLEIRGLKTHFFLDEGVVKAVDGVDLTIRRGRTLCVVGESGCGKSITARSILQIVSPPGRIVDGEILFHRHVAAEKGGLPRTETVDLATMNPRGAQIRAIRGKDISMIFQEPMTSLGPVHTIGNQIMETILLHLPVSKEEAHQRAVDVLRKVGIPRPEQRVDAYPFQLSGGMRQRAMIAMALACEPSLLIADEPTTALDVTTQAQILDLMRELQRDMGMSVMFITHDLGVVAEIADDVAVMYLGIVAEQGDVDSIFHAPKHPYTRALLHSIPRLGAERGGRLASIRGIVPDPYNRPIGCPYHTRCDDFMPGRCDMIMPQPVMAGGQEVRCLLYGGETQRERSA
ncbi:MAG: Oligopeptide transport ATP-binding protein OppD, partial [uncultured Thermomicrobiales bacterium]